MSGELLGSAVLELVVDPTGLAAGMTGARRTAERETAAIQRTVDQRMAGLSNSLSRTGTSLTRGLTLPLLGVGGAALAMHADFEKSMVQIHTLVGASQKQVAQWSKDLLRLGPELGKSPKELAKALYFVTSSGVAFSQALDVVTVSAKASALGLGETQVVADAVTSAMNAYKKEGLSAARATEILLQAVKYGKGEPEELAASLGRVIPIAAKLKIPFEDVGAALASLTLQGLDAAEATTALRAIFTATLNPGKQARDLLADYGLKAQDLRDSLARNGTLGTLQALTERMKGNEEAFAKVFPNVRALVGAFTLTGQAADQNQKIFAGMKRHTDDVGKGFRDLAESDSQKLHKAWATVQDDLIETGETIGNVVLPALDDIVNTIDDVADEFSKLPPGVQETIVKVGLLVAALGPALKLAGGLTRALSAAFAVATAESAVGGAAAGTAYSAAFAATVKTVPIFGPKGQILKNVAVPAAEGAGVAAAGGFAGSWMARLGKLRPRFISTGKLIGGAVALGIALEIQKQVGDNRALWDRILDPLGGIVGLGVGGQPVKPKGSHAGDAYVNAGGQLTFAGQPPGTLPVQRGFNNPAVVPGSAFGKRGTSAYYRSFARRAAQAAGIDPRLFARQIGVESVGYDLDVIRGKRRSPAGAIGIAQFMPGTAKGLGVNPLDPEAALYAAANLMAGYIKRYGGWKQALVAYNAGPGRVGGSLPRETQNYIAKILGGGPGGLPNRKGAKGMGDPAALAWAKAMVGHFKESTGANTGPELDALQKQFGTHAAAWCAEFATTALVKAGFPKSIMTARVADLNAWAKAGAKGLSFTTNPSPGDLMTFGNRHVGIVEKVNQHTGKVRIISGNTSKGEVSRSTYALSAGKYISTNAAGYTPFREDNRVKVKDLTSKDFLAFIQSRLDHFDLMVQAGLMSAAKAALQKRAVIRSRLGDLTGDDRLKALAMLRELPNPPKPRPKTFDATGLGQLFTAMAAKDPEWALSMLGNGRIDLLARQNFATAFANRNPTRANEVSGYDMVYRSADNPWLAAAIGHADLLQRSGRLSPDQALALKKGYLQNAITGMAGDNKLEAEARLNDLLAEIEENTRKTAEEAAQLRQQGIGTAGFLGGLSGPAAGVVRGVLAQYGIQTLPGGAHVSMIGNQGASADLARGDIGALMEEVNSGRLPFSTAWPQIQSDLSVIADATQRTAEASEQTNRDLADLYKRQRDDARLRLAVSQRQYPVLRDFPQFGGSFAAGGRVPGMLGEPRTIIAHGGEEITPVGSDGPRVRVVVEDNRMRVLVDDVEQAVETVTRRMSRNAGRGLTGRGGGLS